MKTKEYPHEGIIVPNGKIRIPSVFMFENNTELFAFLRGCEVNGCTVLFENEGVTVSPVDDRMVVNLQLSLYIWQ